MNFREFLNHAGPAFYVNIAVSILALGIIVERIYAVFFRLRIPVKPFMDAVEKQLLAGKVDRAIQICSSYPDAALPGVIRAALTHSNLGGAAVAGAIEEAMSEVAPKVNKRTSSLWSLANIATLVGLIGTIFGLIGAFAAVAVASPDKKAEMLSNGIAEAMYNTAFGLTIAVSCIGAHLLLTGATKGIVESIEHASVRIENLLARSRSQSRRGQYESA